MAATAATSAWTSRRCPTRHRHLRPPRLRPRVAPDAGGDWLGGDAGGGGSDDWLGGSGSAPQEGHSAGTAPVMDGQGDWMGGGGEPVVTPGMAAPASQQQYAQPVQAAPAPMAMSMGGDMSVTAPQLQQVQPSRRTLGGAAPPPRAS